LSQPSSAPRFRAVFVSDVHIGMSLSREAAFSVWLDQLDTDAIYLNGDIFDGWRLKRRFRWSSLRTRIVNRLFAMQATGTQLRIIPGNHDDFLRAELPAVFPGPVGNEFIHDRVDGRRLLVTHGDLFDPAERRRRGLSKFGGLLFDGVTLIFPRSLSHWIKRSSKRVFGRPDRLARVISAEARGRGLDGIVFGHIHRPFLEAAPDGFILANSGDWVEHASWLAETGQGELQLWDGERLVKSLPPKDKPAQLGRPHQLV
jgi:UDP-2,3-diacylglucosamine pyrophosphatase LpxH